MEDLILEGAHIRLEPLEIAHADALVAAAADDPSLYRLSPVPQGEEEAAKYIATALGWKSAGMAVPFAIVRQSDAAIIGSTRFWNIERWAWPRSHAFYERTTPDACEIGYTWLTRSALRTAANTEAKLLMLAHAFDEWQVLRVCFHTDVRNQRSRAALERIGAQFEGTLRSHRMAADFIPRDCARFSIVRSEWPSVKQRLMERLGRDSAQEDRSGAGNPPGDGC